MKKLDCAPAPCGSCPYRRDVPPGVWDAREYEMLREFATCDPVPALGVFLCHQTHVLGRQTVCRGWLTVERDSIAVRLALSRGMVTPEQVAAPVPVALYATGEEAAAAGLAGVDDPDGPAVRMIAQLLDKGIGGPPDASGDA